jgi:hypothetical protein
VNEIEYLIVYHINCIDGFASAWVVWDYLRNVELVNPKKITLLACDYGDPIPDMTDKIVYIVDFSWYDVDALLAEVAKANYVTMVDHHKEADNVWGKVKTPKNMRYVFDNSYSGVGLVWNDLHDEVLPKILAHIQDRDLWQWKIHGSAEVHTVLKSEGFMSRERDQEKLRHQLLKFSGYVSLGEVSLRGVYEEGLAIARAESTLIDSILERTRTLVDFPTYKPDPRDPDDLIQDRVYRVPVAEVPYDLASEAADKLNKGYPFSVTYETQYALGRRKFSIRSNKETGIDVGAIARQQGGAGHTHSAGWFDNIILSDDFPWRLAKK